MFIFEKSILSFANLDQIEEEVLRGRSVKKMTESHGYETCHCQRTYLFFLPTSISRALKQSLFTLHAG